MNDVFILKSNSILNLYQAMLRSAWAFSHNKMEKHIKTWLDKNLTIGTLVLGYSTDDENSRGFLLYGIVRSSVRNEVVIDNPWVGEYIFPVNIDWKFLKKDGTPIPKEKTEAIVGTPRRVAFPQKITHEQFVEILKLTV